MSLEATSTGSVILRRRTTGMFSTGPVRGLLGGCTHQKSFLAPFPSFSGSNDTVTRKNDTIV